MKKRRKTWSLLERYGGWIAVGLLTLFAWRLISQDLHESEAFSLLFPVHWLQFFPFDELGFSFLFEAIATFLAPYVSADWWMWVQIVVTVLVWTFLYFLIRGMYYASMDGPSMWVTFAFCLIVAFVLIGFMLWPVLQQMEIWREAWPDRTVYP